MTRLPIKNPFKIKGLGFLWHGWQVLASVLARKNRYKTMTCHSWHSWQGKNVMPGFWQSDERKNRVKRCVTEM